MQPRTVFQPERLEELAASIRANGIIQPMIVRRIGDAYQIVAGERRWRAAQLAGLTEVPVVIQDVAEPQLLEFALIENIQREDLNPIETAHAYDRLQPELGLSQEEIGQAHRKGPSLDRQLPPASKLPTKCRASSRLSGYHGACTSDSRSCRRRMQVEIAEKAAAQGLSVRQVEALVQELTADRPRKKAGIKARATSGSQRQGRCGELAE